MAAKTVALFLMAAAVVDAKALDGTKTHASKPKKDKAAPAAAAPSADGGAPPATAAKCARNRVATTPLKCGLPAFPAPPPRRSSKKSSPFTFTASMADDQKKVFKEVRQPASPRRSRFPPRARLRDWPPPQTLKKMSEARKISDTEQRKTTSQALDKSVRLSARPHPPSARATTTWVA